MSVPKFQLGPTLDGGIGSGADDHGRVADHLVERLGLRTTVCQRGIVIHFNADYSKDRERDRLNFAYVQLPIIKHKAAMRHQRASSGSSRTREPVTVLLDLWLLLLSQLETDRNLSSGFSQLISAAICLLALRHRLCLTAMDRKRTGGLAYWQVDCAKSYMESRLDEQISVEDVAKFCGMSAPHFAKSFRLSTGLPPYRWIIARRIARSKELLVKGSMPLVEISMECGFMDQSHFSHAFRREVGMTPGAWRRTHGRLNPRVEPLPMSGARTAPGNRAIAE